jgi:outer membrane protein assembly factor BamD
MDPGLLSNLRLVFRLALIFLASGITVGGKIITRERVLVKKITALFCLGALALAGCSSTPETPYVERPVSEIYNTAMDSLEAGKYEESAKEFDEVERQHPYSKWAPRAQVMAAYSHYRGQKYDNALAAFEAFTQLHPGHEEVPYALYMTGMCYYEQLPDASRDQKDTEDALRVFTELLRRFPNTAYSKDAKYKVTLLRDALAGKEMDIARYYLEKKAYQAAIGRFEGVVKRYDTTKHTEEALYRMVECYLGLGLTGEARKVGAVLGHNYPRSPWYGEAYILVEGKEPEGNYESLRDRDESWLDRLKNWDKGLPKKRVKKPEPEPTDETPEEGEKAEA